jgi:membrane-bound metal-dependent hydrolase YbcI (DUF457 family)
VDPITHALSSLAVARVAGRRLPRFGTAMIVVAGLAPDLDYASYFLGPRGLLYLHRALLHSFLGFLTLAAAIAAAFCYLDRRRPPKAGTAPLRFRNAFAACVAGAGIHVAFDLCNPDGVQLFWPFQTGWPSWDLVANVDSWIIGILAAGIVLPHLFRLVNEEIGDRRKGPGARRAAIAVVLLTIGYLGYRATLHGRAVDLLLSREYHGRVALSAGAFPESSSPFQWRGLVATDNTIEEVEVPVGPGREFSSEQSLTRYKPQEAPVLELGEKTAVTAEFLKYARFPLASVRRLEAGYRFEVHDLRFAPDDSGPTNVFVRVDFGSDLQVKSESFLFASSPNP